MAKQEQHLTTARLSAFIDGQLSPEEQAQTEAHLHTCTVCQQQLTELRQTVALLHALPQPKLPRSFMLPIAEPTIEPRIPSTARPLAPITPLRRRNTWPAYAANVVRYASGLAALIGIVFLLSGLFGTTIGVSSGSGTSTTSTSGSSSNTTATHAPGQTPHITTPLVPGNTYQGVTPSPTPTQQGQSMTSANQNEPVQQNPFQVFLTLFTVSMAGTRTIIGVVLVVLGIIGFIVVRRL